MSQLFRNSDAHTSADAAQLALSFVASHEAKILRALTEHPNKERGLTYRDIASFEKLEPVAVGRRLIAMERKRLIKRLRHEESGKYWSHDGMALWWAV